MTSAIDPDRTPALTSSSGDFVIGTKLSCSATVNGVGSRFYLPAGGTPSDLEARLYLASDLSLLATGSLGSASVAEGWNDVLFSSPYALTPATDYVSAIAQSGTYGYDNDPYGFPVVDPDTGLVTASAGRYGFGTGAPDQEWPGWHGADFLFTAGETATGTPLPMTLAMVTGTPTPGIVTIAGTALEMTLDTVAGAPTPEPVTIASTPLPLRLAMIPGSVSGITPGMLAAGGTSPNLIAGGTSPILTTGGTP